MSFTNLLEFLIVSILFPALLTAIPQDLEVFTDFEDISGDGDFFIGQEPNRVRLVGFTVEILEDSALLHSGTKAITLGPGQEGRIISERGIQFIEFYAGESTGAGRIELRGVLNLIDFNKESNVGEGADRQAITLIGDEGVVEGLPADIHPDANPPLYSFVADSGIFLDEDDFNFLGGITEVKVLNVTGKFSLDDLGFTLTDFPSNNTVYSTFSEFGVGEGMSEPFVLGTSPHTASFQGGFIIFVGSGNAEYVRSQPHSYAVFNGGEATITFETPAYEIDFFGATVVAAGSTDPDGSIEVYDTNDTLRATFRNLEGDIKAEFKPDFITINADDIGAPGGISRIVIKDDPNINPSFSRTSVDDFGFTPIGFPGTGSESPLSVPLVLNGSGLIAGENIQHPNGNIFDQVLLTGESIQLQAKPGQITRVSFMDENEDIVQVEFSGAGTFTVTLDPATFLPSALPPRYNQEVMYVTGKPSVVIEEADSSTFFSIFTVGKINAVNQALFPEGQVYDAKVDATLVQVINSTGMGGCNYRTPSLAEAPGR